MKNLYSWSKKIAEDIERLSSAIAGAFCLVLFAGTLALFAHRPPETTETDAAESAPALPAKIAVRLETFVPEPEPPPPDVPESAPEEPPSPAEPEPPTRETPPPPQEKIEDDALREIDEPPPEPEPTPPENADAAPPEPPKAESVPEPEPTPQDDSAELRARADAERSLYGLLADAVSREKFYPKAARRAGRTGTVRVRVVFDADGAIADFSVLPGAAHASLTAAAIETLRRVSANFSVPADLRPALPAAFVVPLIYDLR
ncbi:MAG: TonB family protein [Candidatus Spyradosoma sp.]